MRVIPEDVTQVAAFILGRWVLCRSERAGDLAGYSRRELRIASKVWRLRNRRVSKKLSMRVDQAIPLLREIRETEEGLRQLARDDERREALERRGIELVADVKAPDDEDGSPEAGDPWAGIGFGELGPVAVSERRVFVAAVEEPLAEYRGVVLDHRRLRETVRALRSSLAPGLAPRILAVVGPTGVGKTTALRAVEREFAGESRAVVKVVCLPPGNKGFEFGQLHWRLLSQAAGGECPDDHICPDDEARRLKTGGANRQGHGTVDEQRLGC